MRGALSVSYLVIGFFLVSAVSVSPVTMAQLPATDGDTPLPSLAPMLEKVNPAVVNIATTATIETPLMRDPVFGFLFQGPRQRQASSLGSGVIIDSATGLILTNHHVIKDADVIQVTLEDGREFNAEIVGSDEKTDVAVLQIEAKNLTAIPLGSSETLRVGDFVVAIGNPFSLGHSVTSGIVSAKGRSGLGIEQYEDFIQTDAAINPGNSGGALVNLRGELIGINTAILGPKGNIGIGFAIPIDLAQTITQQLLDYGKVRRGLIGVAVQELTPSLARALDLPDSKGVIVTEVSPDSSAERAGIKTTDIITHINNRRINRSSDLLNQEGLLPAGSEVELTIVRDNADKKLKLTLDEPVLVNRPGSDFHPLLKGVTLGSRKGVPSEQAKLEVVEIEELSRGAYYGLRIGDIIEGVGRYRISSFSELEQISEQVRRSLPLRINRDGQQFLIVLR